MGALGSWWDPSASGVYTEKVQKYLHKVKKIDSRGLSHPTGEKWSQKHCLETEMDFILLINEHWSNWCNEFSILRKFFAQHNFDKSCWRHRAPIENMLGRDPRLPPPWVHPTSSHRPLSCRNCCTNMMTKTDNNFQISLALPAISYLSCLILTAQPETWENRYKYPADRLVLTKQKGLHQSAK